MHIYTYIYICIYTYTHIHTHTHTHTAILTISLKPGRLAIHLGFQCQVHGGGPSVIDGAGSLKRKIRVSWLTTIMSESSSCRLSRGFNHVKGLRNARRRPLKGVRRALRPNSGDERMLSSTLQSSVELRQLELLSKLPSMGLGSSPSASPAAACKFLRGGLKGCAPALRSMSR